MKVCLQLHITLQLCSQGGTPHDQNHFCLDEVKTIQKEFVLEILDAMNPNFRGDLQDAYDLGSKAFAKYINKMCTGYNGPKPCITPSVLPNVARQDVAKLVKLFAQCQPRYLWEFGQMVKVRLVQQPLSATASRYLQQLTAVTTMTTQ